jgi:hypothetical protein
MRKHRHRSQACALGVSLTLQLAVFERGKFVGHCDFGGGNDVVRQVH